MQTLFIQRLSSKKLKELNTLSFTISRWTPSLFENFFPLGKTISTSQNQNLRQWGPESQQAWLHPWWKLSTSCFSWKECTPCLLACGQGSRSHDRCQIREWIQGKISLFCWVAFHLKLFLSPCHCTDSGGVTIRQGMYVAKVKAQLSLLSASSRI